MNAATLRSINPIRVLAVALIFGGLYLTSLYSYLLFHTLAELFSILIAGSIFVLTWNFRRFFNNSFLVFVGTAYLFFSLIDLAHTLVYKGMGVFQGYGANTPTQLWVAARYLQAVSLLVAPLFLRRKIRIEWLLAGFTLVTGLLLLSIFVWRIFPDSFIEGAGLTPFKIISEYLIDLILIAAVALLVRNRGYLDANILRLLVLSTIFTIIGELFFTFYLDVYGLMNLLGHFSKIIASYLVYKSIVETAATSIYTDMTRIKTAEAALEAYTRQLERSNRELEVFASLASHDLQEPLRKIEAFGSLLRDRLDARLDDTERDYLDRMEKAAQRMRTMVAGLLALSRVTTQGQPFVRVDLNLVAREVLEDLEARIRETGGQVQVGDLPVIAADPLQMHNLFLNLVGNALKYHCPGTPPRVEISSRPVAENGVEISVRDHGIGFDMQHHERIFQMFQRLHGRAEYEGTGFGLAICRKIVERHGGTISAASEPGKGATFFVTLPVDPAGEGNLLR